MAGKRAKNARAHAKIPKCVSVWRLYFVNRRVANLVGFFVILLSAVAASSTFINRALPQDLAITAYALAASVLSYLYVSRVLSSQKPRDYWVCVKERR